MSWIYRRCVRPFLFSMDPEQAHDRAIRFLSMMGRRQTLCEGLGTLFGTLQLPVRAFGLEFPNPVGVAAGLDKHGAALPAWPSLGFGFTELGGVTRHAQPGNPAPRMFRVPSEAALINRMGFNNPGAMALARTLRRWRELGRWPRHPVGINLGKSKITPLKEAAADYAFSLEQLWSLADFFVVNVSSPNTPNLRQLQDKLALDEILLRLQDSNRDFAEQRKAPVKPLLVKVAPDLSWEALDDVVQLAQARKLAGIVATNTTVSRPPTENPEAREIYAEAGGLSGGPLRDRSTEVIRHLYRQSDGAIPIIGVGGISSVEHAWDKITSGASLLQVYSGLIYEGPGLVKTLVEGLRKKLAASGCAQLSDAVGLAAEKQP